MFMTIKYNLTIEFHIEKKDLLFLKYSINLSLIIYLIPRKLLIIKNNKIT